MAWLTVAATQLELEVHFCDADENSTGDLSLSELAAYVDVEPQAIEILNYIDLESVGAGEGLDERFSSGPTKFVVMFPIHMDLNEFIEEGLLPADELSTAGSPFSSDKALLKEILRKLAEAKASVVGKKRRG